jgi:Carboxypeptidase regulatory-like domain
VSAKFGLAVLSLGSVLLLSTAAHAQSTICGTVQNTSGGALAGVTVEVFSPAIPEQKKTAVTNGAGWYSVADLRAGTYRMRFTLEGFGFVGRGEFRLLSDSNYRIDAGMRRGGTLESWVTSPGNAPWVDVQPATTVVVVDRKTIDDPDSHALDAARARARTVRDERQRQLILGVDQRPPDGPAACDAGRPAAAR